MWYTIRFYFRAVNGTKYGYIFILETIFRISAGDLISGFTLGFCFVSRAANTSNNNEFSPNILLSLCSLDHHLLSSIAPSVFYFSLITEIQISLRFWDFRKKTAVALIIVNIFVTKNKIKKR